MMTAESQNPAPKKQRGRPPKQTLQTLEAAENPAKSIEQLTQTCLDTLHLALQQIETLAHERLRQKYADQPIRNVGRELKELLKVMTRYR